MTSADSPKISVIMNCLNGERYLRQAMDSVLEQTYCNWEIIFWDNASTDNSAEIAKSYGEKVRYFKAPVTCSLGKARNLAIQQATGEFIAFLDCDDIWLPKKLEKQMALFEKDPEVSLVFSDMIVFDGKRDIYQFLGKYKPPRGRIFRELLVNYFIGIVSAIIRKSAVTKLEWFDERFENLEDADFFYRIAYYFKVDYVDESLVKWRLHGHSQTFRKFSMYAGERELLLGKLIRLSPNFKKDYNEEIKKYNSKTAQLRVLGEWLNHHPDRAREHISNSGFSYKLRLALYCLTFLPPAIFFPLSKLRFRLRNLVG